MHPRSTSAALAAIRAIGPVDLGIVHPPRPGEARGRGTWLNARLGPEDLRAVLPRAAAANARGAAIYMRALPGESGAHRGIVLVDDVDEAAVRRMEKDGFQPRLVVETSPTNFQVWVALTATCITDFQAREAARNLAERYGGDPLAVAAAQPGRVPGFTNRKPRHQRSNGLFPFVRLVAANPSRYASAGPDLVRQIGNVASTTTAQPARAARAEKPDLRPPVPDSVIAQLDAIYAAESARIDAEVAAGRRFPHAASASERDFALAVRALREGVVDAEVEAWLACRRPEKAAAYASRTVAAAERRVAHQVSGPRPSG